MAAKTGHKKAGGRQKGTPNKTTQDLRTWIHDLLDNNREQITRDLKKLEPHQRIAIYEKLLTYVIPKQQSVSAQIDLNNLTDAQLEIIINELTSKIENGND